MPSLSVLIPARNEMFLRQTIENVLANLRGDTNIIAVLDGAWADPPIPDDPRVTLLNEAVAIGQRAGTNLAARFSRADYVMKLDAHCAVDEGFDVKLMAADLELARPDLTQIPAMYNLHAFNWKCRACGRETYQGPTPTKCEYKLDSKGQRSLELDKDPEPCGAAAGFDRVMVWAPRHRRAQGNGSEGRGRLARTEYWRFDHTLHFQYWDSYRDRHAAKGEIVDVMSSVGACFFMRRDRFEAIGGLDEAHGSWGQYGVEIACKSWLSGGRHVVNKRTWFAHLFRTQGGDFGFPYEMKPAVQEKAREYSRRLWLGGTWPMAKYPLAWLLEKFGPVPDWPNQEAHGENTQAGVLAEQRHAELEQGSREGAPRSESVSGSDLLVRRGGAAPQEGTGSAGRSVTKGLVYYSDCLVDDAIGQAVRNNLVECAIDKQSLNSAIPIASVTLARVEWPLHYGTEVILPLERGYLTMFRQILAGLEALHTDVAFLVEHDVLYHPSHFDFTPERDDVFYYNQHTYKVDAADGKALHYLCSQTSGCCASRQLLVEHYRKRVAHVEEHGFDRALGFEPGTNGRSRELDPHGSATWMSAFPNVDIRHGKNLTASRWSQDLFRNKNSCLGWTEVPIGQPIPGWGVPGGRFREWLAEAVR